MFSANRRKKLRLTGRDYADPGFYFVTICCAKRREVFGSVKFNTVKLSALGQVADQYWREIPQHFAGVKLGEFVIMPNHIHGLLLLPTDLPGGPDISGPYKGSTLSSIVGTFKAGVSRDTGEKNLWQRSFMDRVVRDRRELERIHEYIVLNPERWSGDRYNAAVVEVDDDFVLSERIRAGCIPPL